MILAPFLLLLGLAAANPAAPDFVSEHPHARLDDWSHRQAQIDADLADPAKLKAVRVLFVGDSITELWLLGDDPWVPGRKYGQAIWNESFARPGPNHALNLGVSNDRCENVLQRILPKAQGGLGELDAPQLDPDVIVLMIGINNAYTADKLVADSVFAGVRAVLLALHERRPRARIVLQSLLPVASEASNRLVVLSVNKRLVALAKSQPQASYAHYLDLYPAFVDDKGRQDRSLFNDGLHPDEAGYRRWRDRLVPFLKQVRQSKR